MELTNHEVLTACAFACAGVCPRVCAFACTCVCPRVCPYAYVYACAYAQYAASENQASTLTLTSNKVVNLRTAALLKGNCHERRMHLSKVVCGNMPGFLATFRSRNLLFCL